MSIENTTSFQLSPGETDVYGEKVSPSLMTPYLKGELMCSSTRLVYKVPNTILGLIPLGSNENVIPLKSISSVNTSSKMHIGRLLWGLVLVVFGIAMISKGIGIAFLALVLGAMLLAMCFPGQLNAVNHAGGVTSVTVSILDKGKLQKFAKELQARVFADNEQTRHNEAMTMRLMQTQLQQMQLQQMQNQNQTPNQNNPQ